MEILLISFFINLKEILVISFFTFLFSFPLILYK